MRSRAAHIGRHLALLAGVALVAGCAARGPEETPEVVWPLPPEKPRVKFVKSIRSSADVEPSTGRRFLDTLVGGESATGFTKPYGIHMDKAGRLYVSDSGWQKVLVFDFPKGEFRFLGVDGLGVLAQPIGVSSDDEGRIYVVDGSQGRVVQYDTEGGFLNAFGGRDYLDKPVGLAVDGARDRAYVVDTRAHRIAVFTLDGEFVKFFGGHGPADGQFNWPTNVSVGPDGNVHVVDMLNFRVQVFNPEGEFLWKLGSVGRGFGQFSKPKGIGVDPQGRIYVADAAFNNIQIFDGQGRLLLFFGGMGTGPGRFWMPAGVAVGPEGHIYVADQFNKRVNVYELIRYPEEEGVRP